MGGRGFDEIEHSVVLEISCEERILTFRFHTYLIGLSVCFVSANIRSIQFSLHKIKFWMQNKNVSTLISKILISINFYL